MGSISTTRDEIKTALETITNLRVHDTIPENVNPTDVGVAVVRLGGVPEYDNDFGSGAVFEFVVSILATVVSQRSGQNSIDDLLDPTGAESVKVAVDGGTYTQVDYCRVADADVGDFVEVGGVSYQEARLTVEAVS